MKYIKTLYWAVATLMLIGTRGNTFIEILFTTIILFFTVGIFAYLVSSIGQIIDEINRKDKEFKNDLRVMNHYMKQKYKITIISN